jgi:hypothetical protein
MTNAPDEQNRPGAEVANSLPHDGNNLPAVANQDSGQLKQFVTQIKTAEHQMGEHIITALQDPNTVAVLTAIVAGPEGQALVSAALDPDMLEQVQRILQQAEEKRAEEIPCVGFHCLLKNKDEAT